MHLRVISELPVAIFFASDGVDHDVPRQEEVVGVDVDRLSAAVALAERIGRRVAPFVRSVVRSSDGGVGANVDLSKDRVDSNLVVFPLFESVCLISGFAETIVHNVQFSEVISGITKTNKGNLEASCLVGWKD